MNASVAYWCELAMVAGEVQPSVSISVADGRIAAVDVGVEPPEGCTRRAGLTLPGLANAHSHAFHRALRSRTQSGRGTFWTWRETMYRAAARLAPDSYHRLARATFAEMALAGVTAVGEFHYLHHRPDGVPYDEPNAMGEALLAAAGEAGVRITLLDAAYLHGGLDGSGHRATEGVQRRFDDGSAERWVTRVSALTDGDRHRIGAAIHSVRALGPAEMAVISAWASDRDAPLHAHVSEQTRENEVCQAQFGSSPTALLDRAGVVGDRFTAVHATHVTEHDIGLLAAGGATVCMCPTTERDLGDGIGPTAAFADRGVPIAVGSDSHAVIDPFEEMRAIELDERLRSRQRGIHRAADLVTAATAHGQRSLGWTDAGSLAVGKRADLVTVALDSVRTAGSGAETALEAVAFAATASDVTDVVIDGLPIVVDRRHSSIDVARELDAAITALMED